jgi:hypothetical protein
VDKKLARTCISFFWEEEEEKKKKIGLEIMSYGSVKITVLTIYIIVTYLTHLPKPKYDHRLTSIKVPHLSSFL